MSVELTPDQLHLEVLKAMGWKRGTIKEQSFADPSKTVVNERWISPNGIPVRKLPSLTLDLMWQAEEMLSEPECIEYNMSLRDFFDDTDGSLRAPDWVWHATAEQRARAFLKVKGIS